MLKVTILCVGKLKEKYFKEAVDEYIKRLNGYCNIKVIEVEEHKIFKDNPSVLEINICKDKEGEKIFSKIPKNSYIISMCIEGIVLSSEQLCELISAKMIDGVVNICFIIGGSWGLSDKIKLKSDLNLSISRMTFPHQLARIILCEQIYRIFQIMNSGKYHK